jgi:UPF0288 family protein (methanogenesis marker protein 3)
MLKEKLIFLAAAAAFSCAGPKLAIAQDARQPLHLSCDYTFESKWQLDHQTKGQPLQPADASVHHIYIDLKAGTAKVDNNAYSFTAKASDNVFLLDYFPPSKADESSQIMIDRRSGHLSILKSTTNTGQVYVTNEIYGICAPQVQRF